MKELNRATIETIKKIIHDKDLFLFCKNICIDPHDEKKLSFEMGISVPKEHMAKFFNINKSTIESRGEIMIFSVDETKAKEIFKKIDLDPDQIWNELFTSSSPEILYYPRFQF
jgi:hypothetical protein